MVILRLSRRGILRYSMVFKLKTSKSTLQVFNEIGASIHLQPLVRYNANFCDEDFLTDTDGLELNRQTITGEYDELFKALIISRNKNYLSEDDYFPKYLKAHIDRGAKLLYAEYKYSGSNFYNHLANLDDSL